MPSVSQFIKSYTFVPSQHASGDEFSVCIVLDLWEPIGYEQWRGPGVGRLGQKLDCICASVCYETVAVGFRRNHTSHV